MNGGITPTQALSINQGPFLDDYVARDLWNRLHMKIDRTALTAPGDPLSPSERRLYEALTERFAVLAGAFLTIENPIQPEPDQKP